MRPASRSDGRTGVASAIRFNVRPWAVSKNPEKFLLTRRRVDYASGFVPVAPVKRS
jgi:hypothetical protein